MGVRALALHIRRAPVQILHDKINDLIRLAGDDLEALMHGDVFQHHVHDDGFQRQSQQAEHPRFDAEGNAGHHRDGKIHKQQTLANVDVGLALEDHGHDVRAAAGGLHVEHDGAADGGEGDGEDQLQQGLIGQRRVHGANVFQPPDHTGHQQAHISGAEAEGASEYQKAQQQQALVDDEHKRARRQVRGVMAQNDGNTADAAGGKMIGELKEVNAHAHQKRGQRQHGIVPHDLGRRLFFLLHLFVLSLRFPGGYRLNSTRTARPTKFSSGRAQLSPAYSRS